MTQARRTMVAMVAGAALAATVGFAPRATAAAVNPVTASPYLYQWSNPPDPTAVMSATGVQAFTLAFVLSDGTCNPAWDGQRPLGGTDARLIEKIRGAGGDIVPSFGGWAGNKLGEFCNSAQSLAGAYQKVIDAYDLTAIDIDIEASEFETPAVQDRVLGALKLVKERNPGIQVVVTMPTLRSGPNSHGKRLIQQAKAIGADVDVWTLMPFNFNGHGDMVGATKSAMEGLVRELTATFGWSESEAFSRSGISSMNNRTDVGENVSLQDFQQMRDYAAEHNMSRFTFWALNRDQPAYAFTKVVASYPQ